MLARLRRHLFHTIEVVHDGEPALASLHELTRVRACRDLARASGFRPLGAQQVIVSTEGKKLLWTREHWVLEEVTLTINDTLYCFTTRWLNHEVCSFSNPYPLSRSHLGLDVHAGSGEGFTADLAAHRAKVARASETHGAPTRVQTLEDEDAGERRYYMEHMPLDRLLVTPPGLAWWSSLWARLACVLLGVLFLLAGLQASGVALVSGSVAGTLYSGLALGALVAFLLTELPTSLFHDRHFHDRSAEVERAGVANAKELSIATFKQAVTERLRAQGRAARSCHSAETTYLGSRPSVAWAAGRSTTTSARTSSRAAQP